MSCWGVRAVVATSGACCLLRRGAGCLRQLALQARRERRQPERMRPALQAAASRACVSKFSTKQTPWPAKRALLCLRPCDTRERPPQLAPAPRMHNECTTLAFGIEQGQPVPQHPALACIMWSSVERAAARRNTEAPSLARCCSRASLTASAASPRCCTSARRPSSTACLFEGGGNTGS